MSDTRLQRFDQWLRGLLPLLLTLFLVLVAVLPFGFAEARYILPALPLMSIYFWIVHRPDLLRPLHVFLAGLVFDIVAGLPVGVSAAVWLIFAGLLSTQRRTLLDMSFYLLWWGLMLAGLGALLLQWGLVSLLLWSPIGPGPLLLQYAFMMALYPPLSAALTSVLTILPRPVY